MTSRLELLRDRVQGNFSKTKSEIAFGELTTTVPVRLLLDVCLYLRETEHFEQLIDIAGVDYLHYGDAEWETRDATTEGFSRGVNAVTAGRFSFDDAPDARKIDRPRFGVVCHFLSVTKNIRIRLVVHCENDEFPVVPSLIPVWSAANWFEREAFDLFGIMFTGHPDLRRLLTDYGFVGHPFRKDFPLIGNVEMIYDEKQRRVVYQPVSIEPRVLVPRVIRDDKWKDD